MVYNREVLTTDISSSILTLTDHAKTEPTITALPASLMQPISIPSRLDASSNRECVIQFQRMFEAFVTHIMACYKAIVAHAGACERIMEELRMQALAVQVALTNLDAHSRSVLETFEKFNVLATKEFSKQARLLQSFPRDIEALRQIKVHSALLPADSPERYISDFIPTEKLILWAERCRETHEALLRDGKDLSLSIKEVQEGTEAIKNNSGINLDQLEDSMVEILQTVEQQSQIRQRVERGNQLANVYKTDYIDSSQKADGALREKLAIFISAKRSQTANLISQLMHISKLQSTIANIPLSLSNLDDALGKRETDFSQLVYVQRIPIAYGALIVEIVRRREYSKLLLQKSQQLAEVMSRFRQLEQRRRDSFRSEVAKFVPVVVPGLDDVPPFCEINALHTRDRLPPFTREQVAEFERLVSQLSNTLGGPENEGYTVESMAGGASSISSGQESYQDALSKLRVTMVKMTTQMDVMGGEFDRILEKSFYSDRIQRLEEENARLRADMSRTDVQQHPGTPLLSQAPFPRHGTPVGGAGNVSTGLGSTSAQGVSTIAPTSPELSRQPSRGIGSSGVTRVDSEEHQQAFQQQAQQNQRLTRENSDLLTKIKAYEGRIRSLEETLYQYFRAGTGVDSSASGKDPKLQTSSQSPEDSQLARSLSQARGDRKRDEEKIRALEQELTDTDKKMEQVETRLRNEYTVSQQAMTVNDELRQEILELKLQYATVEEQSDAKTYDREVILRRSDELEEELKGMNIKCEHMLEHHESIKREHDLETKAFKDRIDELANQSTLEKEILEGHLEQARRTAEETSERVTELENELAVVNEELQNKVLELEEELETHTTQHEEVKARAEELEKQLDSHRAVHTDILVLLKEQEQKTATAEQNARGAKDEQEKQKETLAQLETDHDQVAKQLEEAERSKEELAQQTEALRKQNSELEAQWESYKIDVNLRLEEAKSMVRRAEEDWKEKSRLLDQMEGGIHDLGEPIRECTRVLGQEEDGLTMPPTLDIVKTHMQAIGQGIKELVLKHESDLAKEEMLRKEQREELVKEHETSQQTLQDMVESLKKTSREAEEGAATQRTRLESTIDHLKEELELIKIQHQDEMKTPVVTTTITTACADEDRQLLAALSLDLGIALPSVSEEESEVLSPSSSVLFDNAERRQKTPPSMGASTLTTSGSAATTAGSSSRSSSAIVPLSKDILDTFDYAELDVTKTVALIKKRFYDTEHLLRRWQRECRHLKDKYNRAAAEAHEKIAFRNFKVDDLTLFLPTRNSISKPWAAFNINFPHYFLQMTPSMANQLRNREWIVARITSITEAVVDKRVGGSGTGEEEEDNGGAMASSTLSIVSPNNPFGLADGVKYYLLEATSWNGYHGHGKSASSYHSSSTGGSSSSKLRHHASTSALAESSSSLSRHRDRRERESETGERRRHRDRPEVREEESSQSSRAHREALLEESSLNVRVSTSPTSSSSRARDSRDFSLAAVTGAGMGTGTGEMARSSTPSAASSSLMSLLRSSNSSGHLNRDSQSTTTALSTTTVSPSSAGIVHEETGRAAASLQQTQTQRMRHMRHESRDRGSLVFGEGEGEGEGGALSSSSTGTNVVGHRNSIGAAGSLPISIPFQSAATSALRAISSSVGSTGSTGSGSGAGTGSGSVSGTMLAASSPPRTMIMSSSPHRTSVTTVSAVGTTVSVNPSSGGGNSASSAGTGSPNMGSSMTMSTAPVHPSRLSMSSHRDDFEQEHDTQQQQQQQQQQEDEGEHFAVFATDEDQERQRTRGFNRTMSSTSTWHGLPAEDL
ncbi:oligomeric, coiled-coil, peripheral membrane protein [Lunasporangiospora selenospora]|uniref:Autophagy-related protein 11 n=1 Tax=Lunasporangiospora selenospora TaxID=979761 RepID=A0A9P6KE36_9FUNG|nr:oligomeric, coiled-coil, peripheral membrane protein [Lunasporangiospora selenospora]